MQIEEHTNGAHTSKLTLVPVHELANVWPLVRDSLELVKIRAHSTWQPEHVFAALYNKNAELHLIHTNGLYCGFVVLMPMLDPFNGERTLVIWCGYSRVQGTVQETMPLVEEYARENGFKYVVSQSPRKGWLRVLGRMGYMVKDYVLQKRVA